MIHLADPEAEKRIYNIHDDEEFLTLTNQKPNSMDVKISFLVKMKN